MIYGKVKLYLRSISQQAKRNAGLKARWLQDDGYLIEGKEDNKIIYENYSE